MHLQPDRWFAILDTLINQNWEQPHDKTNNKIFLLVISSGVTGALNPQSTNNTIVCSICYAWDRQRTVRQIFATWGWEGHKILKIDEVLWMSNPFQLLLNSVTPGGTNSPLTSASANLLSSLGPLCLNKPKEKMEVKWASKQHYFYGFVTGLIKLVSGGCCSCYLEDQSLDSH